jgi:hypothetical protein
MFGVQNVEVEEIYSLDPNEQRKEKSYGLIFLFKWRQEADSRPVLDPMDVPELFFARQIGTVSFMCCSTNAFNNLVLCETIRHLRSLECMRYTSNFERAHECR